MILFTIHKDEVGISMKSTFHPQEFKGRSVFDQDVTLHFVMIHPFFHFWLQLVLVTWNVKIHKIFTVNKSCDITKLFRMTPHRMPLVYSGCERLFRTS